MIFWIFNQKFRAGKRHKKIFKLEKKKTEQFQLEDWKKPK